MEKETYLTTPIGIIRAVADEEMLYSLQFSKPETPIKKEKTKPLLQIEEELEEYFERKVYIQLWVKVRENWSDDAVMLRSIGYIEE